MELRDGELLLRPWSESDVPGLVVACNDPEIARWIPPIPHPYTEEDAREFIEGRSLAAPDYSVPEQSFAIAVNGALAGAIGMRVNSHDYRGHVGYWVAAPARGRGVCTRALRLLARHGQDELELQRVELITDPDNGRRSASPRRSASGARVCCARTCGTRTGAFGTR